MHITAICPKCKNRYQVDPALLGKKMRCPNPQCRVVFDVSDPSSAPSGPAKGAHVSDFVPIEKAENEGPSVADWRSAPPPRGESAPVPSSRPAPPPARQPAAKPAKAARPAAPPARPAPPEPEPGNGAAVADWHAAPPPVARPGPAAEDDIPPLDQVEEETPRSRKRGKKRGADDESEPVAAAYHDLDADELARQKKKRRARRLMIFMITGLLVVVGGGGYFAFTMIRETEEKQADLAMKDYMEVRYPDAEKKFRNLVTKFKDSPNKPKYEFMASLCSLLASVGDEELNIVSALEQMEKFLDADAKSSSTFLKEHGRDIGEKLFKRINAYLEKERRDDPELETVFNQILAIMARVLRLLPDSIKEQENEQVQNQIAEARKRIDLALKEKTVLAQIRLYEARVGSDAIKDLKNYLRRSNEIVPGVDRNAQALQAIERMEAAHLAGVKYVPADPAERPPTGSRAEDTEPSILIDPSLTQGKGAPPGPPVTALCRGVLYILDASDGKVLWAMRTGIDTTQLPIRLPPLGDPNDERLLVLSADTQTLTAYGLSSKKRLWEYHLGSPCLGKPLLVRGRVYLATFDGRVHEVSLDDGTLKGRFHLGQRLSTGGVHHRATNRLYFPGVDSCVYVLNATDQEQKCDLILYTNHAAGSLRGEPLILNEEGARGDGGEGSYLLIPQATGIDETQLKPYQLPLATEHDLPVNFAPLAKVRGWTWFTPRIDSEKVVILSDSARLGLFGIKQAKHKDSLLFPLVADKLEASGAQKGETSGIDISEHLGGLSEGRRGRSLVVHVQGEDLWLLALGRMQRMEIRFDRLKGPQLAKRWMKPLELGSPLLPEQVRESPDGLSIVLVTQPLGRPECVVTAVDPEAPERGAAGDPRIRWQRQLGVVCHGEPLLVGGEVLAMDRAGGFFRFDPAKFKGNDRWQIGGEVVASGLESSEPPQLLQSGPGTVYSISSPGGNRLLVRRYDAPANAGGAAKVIKMPEVDLPARVAGNVVLLGNALVVPLDNGKLVRLAMPLTERMMVEDGQTWRSRWAATDSRCQIVPLDGETFLTTDGNRAVTQRTWKGPSDFRSTEPLELTARIVGTPQVLPRANAQAPLQKVIADNRGVLSFFHGDQRDSERTWNLKGTITAGPFLRGSMIGCVVDKTRLVLIDPMKGDVPPLEYQGGEAIVGEPRQVADLLVVADSGGKIVGLDPKTAKPVGEGYTLKALVAPSTTPVEFGAGRAFVPLTDGTIMMLSLDRLRGK